MSSNAFITQIKNQIDLHLGVDGKPPLNVDGEAFVVSLYGEWGIGKTHSLKALEALYQKALQDIVTNDTAQSITIPVMFSPWRFEKEAHLIVPLVKTIQAKLEALVQSDVLAQAAKEWTEHLKNGATALGNMALSLAAAFKFKVSLLGLIEGDLDLDKTLKHDKDKHNDAKETADKARKKQLPPEAESLYYDTLTWLKKLCIPSKENASQPALRFVLFIDDLDRCLPEKAVEMLESIKLFLDIPSFAFVIGVDNEVIERGIRHRYDAYLKLDAYHLPITGHEYLEKIIHLPLMLPRMREDQARALLDGYRERALAVLPTVKDITKEADQRWREIVNLTVQLVPLVPRKLIRAMEGLLFRLHVFAADHAQRTDLSEGMTLRFVVLQQLYPEIYRLVKIKPENWFRLLGVVVERGVLRIQDEWGSRDAFSLSGLNAAIGNIESTNRPKEEIGHERGDNHVTEDVTKIISKGITGNPAPDSLIELRDLLQSVQGAQQQRGSKDPLLVFRSWDDAKLELPSIAHSVYFSYGKFPTVQPLQPLNEVEFNFIHLLTSVMRTVELSEVSSRAQAMIDLDLSSMMPSSMDRLLKESVFDPASDIYLKTLQDEIWWEEATTKVKSCRADVQKIWDDATAKRMKAHQLVSPRYQLVDDPDPAKAKEVRDLKTGLIWRRFVEDKKFNFDDAQTHAVAKATGKKWRVPDKDELKGLVEKVEINQANQLATIDHAAFPDTPPKWFWTSSPYVGNSDFSCGVGFSNGYVSNGLRSNSYYVRLVR